MSHVIEYVFETDVAIGTTASHRINTEKEKNSFILRGAGNKGNGREREDVDGREERESETRVNPQNQK